MSDEKITVNELVAGRGRHAEDCACAICVDRAVEADQERRRYDRYRDGSWMGRRR